MQVADVGFSQWHCLPCEVANIMQRFEMIDCFEMIFQRLPPMVIPCSITMRVSAAVSVFPSIAFDV